MEFLLCLGQLETVKAVAAVGRREKNVRGREGKGHAAKHGWEGSFYLIGGLNKMSPATASVW